ncbi:MULTISPECIES: phage tail protein [unclassified Serratia (in: enterobacteria)]|uniref:phage tail protein n=1 Tax=unclassified Serratia (in: enterobacteria) TaxID=2647522 RepID=UPI0030768069
MKTFTWIPEESLQVSVKPKVKVVSFGDGYEQRSPDGINNQLRSYSLQFSGSAEDVRTIDQFLTEHGGAQAFSWLPPDTLKSALFKCEEWNLAVNGYWNSLSATFQEVVA